MINFLSHLFCKHELIKKMRKGRFYTECLRCSFQSKGVQWGSEYFNE